MSETLTFGEWLKRRRKGLDLTREKLAWRVSCSFETIKKVEAGDLKPSVQLAEQLAEKLGVPVPEREAFIQFARSQGAMDAFAFTGLPVAAAAAPPQATHVLPAPLTSLLGRAREMHVALELLARPDVRLLTLTGPPGAGKTRLALAVGAHAQSSFADGACFVPLAPLQDPALFADSVAQALGFHELRNEPLKVTLHNAIRELELLLLIDNFEQVIAAAPQVSELLQVARRGKIIVTSREPLHVYGEREFPVPPLELPDVNHLPPIEALAHYAAVQLFIARAQAVKPEFELTSANADAIARLCALLDGLPLAIEMAAAQVRRHSPQWLLAQLNERLVNLGAGLRDLSPRQQTLRGAIDWSYELLNPAERRVFDHLGVLIGGGEEEAIAALVETEPGAGSELESQLESLADKNLVKREADSQENLRYFMLEMIREYARDKLRAEGEWEVVRQRHAAYFTRLAHQVNETAQSDPARFDQLEREHDNLRAALRWALEQADARYSLMLCGELGAFWLARGHWSEGFEWARRALAQGGGNVATREDQLLRAQVLHNAGQLAEFRENHTLTRALYLESLELRRALEEPQAIVESLMSLTMYSYFQSAPEAGRRYGEEALALCRAQGDLRRTATLLNHLGRLALGQDDYPAAQTYLQESLTLSRQLQDDSALALTLYNLGVADHIAGRWASARANFFQSLALRERLGDKRGIANTYNFLGLTAVRAGEYAEAGRLLEASLRCAHELNDRYGEAITLINLGRLAFEQGDLDTALQRNTACLQLAEQIGGRSFARRIARDMLARFALATGDNAAAHEYASEGLEAWRAAHSYEEMVECLRVLGFVALAGGDLETAHTHFAEERQLCEATGNESLIARALADMGYLALRENDLVNAEALYRRSLSRAHAAENLRRTAFALLGLAGCALARGQAEHAARLVSASTALRERLKASLVPLPAQMRSDYLGYEAQARRMLTADAFDAAWEAGRARPLAETVIAELQASA